VNRDEAKQILLLYRPGTADAEDPQIAEALALAKQDTELERWLEKHCECQAVLRAKIRQLAPPAGLKEQILSEHAAGRRRFSARQKFLWALAAVILLLGTLAVFWLPRSAEDNSLAIYQNRMARVALSPYGMDLLTNNPAPIRTYLAQRHAPADFVLPAPLQQAVLTGCAVEQWQGAMVTMICFRTGKPLPPGSASDLWLFVVDRAAVKDAPEGGQLRLAKVNLLITASWTQGGRLYFLGTEGEATALKQYL